MSIHNEAGTPGVLRRIARFVFSRTTMVFYEYHYNNRDAWRPPQDGSIFRALVLPSDHGKLSELLALQRDSEPVFKPIDMQEAARRLQKGEVCYIGENQGKIVGYSWFAKQEKYIPEIESTICLGPQDLYLYNSYIVKAYRRQNIVGGNINAARADLIPQGFTREITATMNWNKAAAGSLMKLNFRVAGTVTAGYFLTLRYMINGCRDIAFRNETGIFGFYRKLFRKFSTFLRSMGVIKYFQGT